MTDLVEDQLRESSAHEDEPLEGFLECPQQRSKMFHSYNEVLDWVAFARPTAFQMNSGVLDSKAVWQVIYVGSTGGE